MPELPCDQRTIFSVRDSRAGKWSRKEGRKERRKEGGKGEREGERKGGRKAERKEMVSIIETEL